MVEQYKIIDVNLDPILGREKGKYRPCVVLSRTSFNNKTSLVWVSPITSRPVKYPTDVALKTMEHHIKGTIDVGQIRTLDLSTRHYREVDSVSHEVMHKIDDIITNILKIESF
ncbi:type II toxin-antitoxin system PemK/MazF family toxin [Staphylococcus condimenti]|uniref:Endoribonuclease MazF n=1 Tax=Staphylococcus condimenti TaxID=70255 RepID=A0A143PDI0_9STAP|nr:MULTISPECIES: type II toxin-antitoxin system PemK/MazF family toxin [Staphylococcus]AMY05814.1 cell growth inhibitor, pemK-like protein [Staphylococcus condimenti]APR62018.1 cell growth inhibitor, pemK-like protein [Staphylococcus condimenti]MDK8645364.1 type II toxin-antitoxin system PemK/MazF family toxin [Staphylococcus condimenti]OFP04065.1 cell growth inhibitor, pemK-like protein [Staphylococcus sp. HMSC065E08]PNZ56887.1 type II toxin-antitoxin system PemK/MazF family toxin [Staphyloco